MKLLAVLARFPLACLLLLVAGFAIAPSARPLQGNRISKLAERIYVHMATPDSDAVSNSGFIVLESAVLVFDTHFTPEAGQALLAEIGAITAKPVRYVVNSHFHPDHTHGNRAFAGAQQILASTNARRDMLQKDLPAMNRTLAVAQSQLEKMRKDSEKDANQQSALRSQIRQRQEFLERMMKLKILPPVMTLDDSLYLADGARELELLYLGPGHTDGDIVLFLPEEKIAFLGDLFFGRALPNTQDSLLLDWIKTLGAVLKLQAETFIPGHGPVGTREQVKEFLAYLEDLKALVEPPVTRGDSMEQVLRDVKLPEKYSSYDFQNFFPANVRQMYVELKARQLASKPTAAPEGAKKSPPEDL